MRYSPTLSTAEEVGSIYQTFDKLLPRAFQDIKAEDTNALFANQRGVNTPESATFPLDHPAPHPPPTMPLRMPITVGLAFEFVAFVGLKLGLDNFFGSKCETRAGFFSP